MTDPRRLRDLASACRFSAAAHLLEVRRLEREPGTPSERAADLCAMALRLEESAQHLQAEAHDPELLAFLAHRAAGGQVALLPLPVVVGHAEQDRRAPANDAVRGRLGALLRRLSRRQA